MNRNQDPSTLDFVHPLGNDCPHRKCHQIILSALFTPDRTHRLWADWCGYFAGSCNPHRFHTGLSAQLRELGSSSAQFHGSVSSTTTIFWSYSQITSIGFCSELRGSLSMPISLSLLFLNNSFTHYYFCCYNERWF